MYDSAVGVTLSDEPKLLAVNVVRSNGSQALTGHHLVDMLPQSDLPSEEEHFVAGRQVLSELGCRTSSLATSSASPTPRS